MLEAAADAPVARPLPGVILSLLSDPEGDEETEDVVGGGGGGGQEQQEGTLGRGKYCKDPHGVRITRTASSIVFFRAVPNL